MLSAMVHYIPLGTLDSNQRRPIIRTNQYEQAPD